MRRVALLAAALWLGVPPVAAAQERCVLRITAPTRSSVAAPGGERAYTTYLGGGTVTVRCADAVMTGDSAVQYGTEERAEMIGRVAYRDTTRTLSADRLTYFEPTGQVVATGDVELVRLSTRARLRGPRVSFFRAAGAGGRTVATNRPHMTVPPEGGTGEPIEVDADVAEFVGDTLATGRGAVEIRRSDFEATADSARFRAETGRLYGRPVVTARGIRLEGDSIHARLASGAIDRLHAFGAARGEGESVELEAGEIVVAWGANDVERIESFGEGRAIAAAPTFLFAGDSLEVAFTAGEADSVTAVGEARAFQLQEGRDPGTALAEPAPELSDRTSWIEGDSIRAWLDPRGAVPAGAEASARIRRLRARGEARSYFAAVRDTVRSERASRNYIIGDEIEIDFVDGEPARVTADRAIGVFLEPSDAPRGGETPPRGGETPPPGGKAP